MFFVLSGFLIGGILIKTINRTDFTHKELVGFWIRRWFRTLPMYYLVLSFLVLNNHFIIPRPLPHGLSDYFFFLQNLTHPCSFEFFGVSWSLCVEEWFYLLVPLFLFIILRFAKQISKKRKILFCIIFVIVFITVCRTYKIYTLHFDLAAYRKLEAQVIARLDSIMYGVLGAYLFYYKVPIWRKYNNAYFIIGVLIILSTNYFDFPAVLLYTLRPIGTLFILPKLSSIEKTTWKGGKVITFISLISYSMYLLHVIVVLEIIMPLIFMALHITEETSYTIIIIKTAMYWSLTILLSYVLYMFYEKPMTNLRDKIVKR